MELRAKSRETLFWALGPSSFDVRTLVSLAILDPAIVLLVEDSVDDERIAVRALRKVLPPIEIQVARDGQQALDALGLGNLAGDPAPALVLCDLKLPKVSGDEVLRRFRADLRLKEVPFVVFSSSDEPSDVARCEAYGVSEYAVKPVDFSEYGERVAGLVRRHLPAFVA